MRRPGGSCTWAKVIGSMIEEESDFPRPSFDQLIEIDDELADKGIEAFKRPYEAARLWGLKHGNEFLVALKMEGWFGDTYRQLHPSIDFSAESFLTLSVSARGISYFVKPPIAYGTVAIKPMDYVAISQNEMGRLWHRHPDAFWDLQWQGFDAVDLFMSLVNFHPTEILATNMMQTAVSQLTASARQLVACELDSSLPQGMAMACELAGKSLLVANGSSERELRALGHDLTRIHNSIKEILPSPIDFDINEAIKCLPAYVTVRYNAPVLQISAAQDLYRKAMFIVADFLRRTNHSQGYWDMLASGEMPGRKISG